MVGMHIQANNQLSEADFKDLNLHTDNLEEKVMEPATYIKWKYEDCVESEHELIFMLNHCFNIKINITA